MSKSSNKATGAKTNIIEASLVKVVVKSDDTLWLRPSENEAFLIDEDGVFPAIVFELNLPGDSECKWTWEMLWKAATSGLRESKKRGKALKIFRESGSASSQQPLWTADFGEKTIGGTLTVKVTIDRKTYKRSARIIGTNPDENKIIEYLERLDDSAGFDKIIRNKSRFKHFITADGEPVVAFDGGYGLTQLTNPKPTFSEAWDWKANLRAGLKLYHLKKIEAKSYLTGPGKNKRTFTDQQLQLETWCRWNSGSYHVWDKDENKWIRNPNILSDTKTANIGWELSKPENTGKTEEELHDRDKNEYSKPKTNQSLWRYSGVVYADHINEN